MVMFLVSFSSYLRMTEGAYMVLLHMSPAQISKDVFNRLATHLSVENVCQLWHLCAHL